MLGTSADKRLFHRNTRLGDPLSANLRLFCSSEQEKPSAYTRHPHRPLHNHMTGYFLSSVLSDDTVHYLHVPEAVTWRYTQIRRWFKLPDREPIIDTHGLVWMVIQ
jgi:hypothetical protein